MYHIATINAFANKFGDFTGAILNKETGAVVRERFATLDDARNWVRKFAWDQFGPVNFAAVARKGEYYANVWKSAK